MTGRTEVNLQIDDVSFDVYGDSCPHFSYKREIFKDF